MNFDEIKSYWEDRAASDSSAQSTTQDYYLREIEFNVLREHIASLRPATVVDLGCGDGRTTLRLAEALGNIRFQGFDYSPAMIGNAMQNLESAGLDNVAFGTHDVCETMIERYDLAYTTRCLINLPDKTLQARALRNIHDTLQPGGTYLMVENFVEGQVNFNQVRRDFGLPEIPIRDHNLFFSRNELLQLVEGMYRVENEINISSTYYMVSRIIYSKICAETGAQPDYFDDHHRFATALPFLGEYGPVRMLVLRKIQGEK